MNRNIRHLAFAVSLCLLPAGSTLAADWRSRASDAESEITKGDIAAELSFGRTIAARILGRYKAYENPALTRYVNLVGNALAQSTNRPELEFHLAILDTDDINAFAAPGGYIFLTRGALKYMSDESELAGVLAHEVAHITERHVVKELKIKGSDESGTTDLAKLIGGGSEAARAAFGQAIEKGLEMIFTDGYKKADEMQADRSAVTISALTGYDPSGLSRYLAKIKPLKSKTPVPANDDHPTFDARILQISEGIAKDGINTKSLAKNNNRFAEAIKQLK